MPPLTESLAQQIRVLRERRMGLSMQALATNELDAKFLGEVERGETIPGIEKLQAIAKALQMPLWELIRTAEVASERPAAGDAERQPAEEEQRSVREPARGPSAPAAGTRRFLVVVQQTGTRYAAHVPDLPGCFVWGRSAQALEAEMPRAIAFHLHRLRALGEPVPDPHSYAIQVEPKDTPE